MSSRSRVIEWVAIKPSWGTQLPAPRSHISHTSRSGVAFGPLRFQQRPRTILYLQNDRFSFFFFFFAVLLFRDKRYITIIFVESALNQDRGGEEVNIEYAARGLRGSEHVSSGPRRCAANCGNTNAFAVFWHFIRTANRQILQ